MRYLIRHHVVEEDEGQTRFLTDDLAEREPALAQLAAAAVSGLPPAGPELRRKPLTVVLPASDGPKVVRPLCVEDGGFSLHAASRVGAEDDLGRTNLSPRFHSIRYGGILAPHAQWRPLVIPPPPPETAAPAPTDDLSHSLPMPKDTKARPLTHRCGYIPWQRLLRQLGIDVETCPRCGGKMKVIAPVKDPQGIARYPGHLGLPTEEPSMAPARAPPFWQSRVLRRRYGEPPDAGQA